MNVGMIMIKVNEVKITGYLFLSTISNISNILFACTRRRILQENLKTRLLIRDFIDVSPKITLLMSIISGALLVNLLTFYQRI